MILGKFYNIQKKGVIFYLHALKAFEWSDVHAMQGILKTTGKYRIVYNALPYDKNGNLEEDSADGKYFNYVEMFERCTVVHRHECV
jgi:hypothetical protein